MELVLGSRLVLGLAPHNKLVLELALGSKLVLELELGSIQVLELVQGSKLELVHSSRCLYDGEDLLRQLEQRKRLRPTQPKLESQTSWSYLLTKEPLVGRAYKYTMHAPAVNRASRVAWLSWQKFSGKSTQVIAKCFQNAGGCHFLSPNFLSDRCERSDKNEMTKNVRSRTKSLSRHANTVNDQGRLW